MVVFSFVLWLVQDVRCTALFMIPICSLILKVSQQIENLKTCTWFTYQSQRDFFENNCRWIGPRGTFCTQLPWPYHAVTIKDWTWEILFPTTQLYYEAMLISLVSMSFAINLWSFTPREERTQRETKLVKGGGGGPLAVVLPWNIVGFPSGFLVYEHLLLDFFQWHNYGLLGSLQRRASFNWSV